MKGETSECNVPCIPSLDTEANERNSAYCPSFTSNFSWLTQGREEEVSSAVISTIHGTSFCGLRGKQLDSHLSYLTPEKDLLLWIQWWKAEPSPSN
jgi:hypothetical protein